MTEYAYSFSPQLSSWIGRFESRAAAEEAARESTFSFVMVWTAEIRDLALADLISGEQILNLLSEGLCQGAWCDESNTLQSILNELPPDDVSVLEAEVNEVIEEWAIRILGNPTFPVYVNVQPSWCVVDYEQARKALAGKNTSYASDAPVRNEFHYMTLDGRITRFQRLLCRGTRQDLKGRSLDTRIETMILAMVEWDGKFPLPGLAQYEKRIREIKHELRSPWPSIGIFARLEDGKHDYSSDQWWSDEERINRSRYADLQRELLWLKRRVTKIYVARTMQKRSGVERSRLSLSETPA